MRESVGVLAITAILSSTLFAQAPPPAVAFEVASIKPAAPINPRDVAAGKLHVGVNIDQARVDIGFLSLAEIIPIAYRVKPHQVSGPDWMVSQRFDILAKIPEGATREQVPEMLQALLAERFGLTMHRENKEHSVYALVVAKGGPKLKDAPPEPEAPAADAANGGIVVGNGEEQVRVKQTNNGATMTGGKNGPMKVSMGPNGMHWEAERMTMGNLVDMLSRFVDRPVIDMTELTGRYQVALDLSMEDLRNVAKKAGMAGQMPPGPAGPEGGAKPGDVASDPSGGSIFAALRDLGLRLESRKSPVETIVIDHLEKLPTEN